MQSLQLSESEGWERIPSPPRPVVAAAAKVVNAAPDRPSKILDSRQIGSEAEYFVRWQGKGPFYDSWVRDSQLLERGLVIDFERARHTANNPTLQVWTPEKPEPPEKPVDDSIAHRRKVRSGCSASSASDSIAEITLLHLLHSGLLRHHEPLKLQARGSTYSGILLDDGRISADGIVYADPTSWATTKLGIATDGWKAVRATGLILDKVRGKLLELQKVQERQVRAMLTSQKRKQLSSSDVPARVVEAPLDLNADLSSEYEKEQPRKSSRSASAKATQAMSALQHPPQHKPTPMVPPVVSTAPTFPVASIAMSGLLMAEEVGVNKDDVARWARAGHCTYELGYCTQRICVCLTCSLPGQPCAALCTACMAKCHRGHEVVFCVGSQSGMKCDCGNSKCESKCTLTPNKDPLNVQNRYGREFELTVCCRCWGIFHREHAGLPSSYAAEHPYPMYICQPCIDKFVPYLAHFSVQSAMIKPDRVVVGRLTSSGMALVTDWQERLKAIDVHTIYRQDVPPRTPRKRAKKRRSANSPSPTPQLPPPPPAPQPNARTPMPVPDPDLQRTFKPLRVRSPAVLPPSVDNPRARRIEQQTMASATQQPQKRVRPPVIEILESSDDSLLGRRVRSKAIALSAQHPDSQPAGQLGAPVSFGADVPASAAGTGTASGVSDTSVRVSGVSDTSVRVSAASTGTAAPSNVVRSAKPISGPSVKQSARQPHQPVPRPEISPHIIHTHGQRSVAICFCVDCTYARVRCGCQECSVYTNQAPAAAPTIPFYAPGVPMQSPPTQFRPSQPTSLQPTSQPPQ
eukprot:TRINITY_DN3210_c0_g1_i1.p1 TRINITY_DN3210_c0_g1~~TRINITY_DN3210_c0_g1_i1.p1  ORF type:complete len:802 (+),score=154.58 TRINITY_DN3210_c0_g1_i1:3-2408(+)